MAPPAVTIRACRADEGQAVLDAWKLSGTLPTVSDDLESVQRCLATPTARLLVADADGAIAGTIIAGWDGWRGTIYRLAVLPDFRRRGIARALVEAALQWHRAQGARRTVLITHFDEPHAMAFWQSMSAIGFAHSPNDARFYVNLD